jgi:hypothetical protein
MSESEFFNVAPSDAENEKRTNKRIGAVERLLVVSREVIFAFSFKTSNSDFLRNPYNYGTTRVEMES